MHPTLQRVFDYLTDYDIAIYGSAVRDVDTAHDIDVFVPGTVDFRWFCANVGSRYQGAQQTPIGVIRRTQFVIPGVDKLVQASQNDRLLTFEAYPYAVLLRDGTVLHPGVYFQK